MDDVNSQAGYTLSDSEYSSDVCEFWDSVIDIRIASIGSAPPPQRYAGTTTSSSEALDREEQALQDTMETIQYRFVNEERAMYRMLQALHEHCSRERRNIERSIATIRGHRNLLAPVMCLPPEILSRILVFHAQAGVRWLKAALTSTYVCGRWRQVGLRCPELWSHLNCHHYRTVAGMATIVDRSRAVSLSLTIPPGAVMVPGKMALIANNMHRLKRLSLDVPTLDSHDLFSLFSQPTPLLQHLTMSYFGPSNFAFPLNFLSGSAPNLHHIKLSVKSCVPWASGLFANLVTLEVSGDIEGAPNGPDAPSLEMLRSALARMPELETLVLRRCFPLASTAKKFVSTSLPKLRRLEVAGHLWDCVSFLRQITTNASTVVLLDLKCSDISEQNIKELFIVFQSNLFVTPKLAPIAQVLKFAWRDSTDFKIDMWSVNQDGEVKDSRNPSTTFNFSWTSSRSRGISPLAFTQTCFMALASPQLRSFRILDGHITGWDARVWRNVAQMAPGLQRLAPGTGPQCTEFCKVLCPPDGPDQEPEDCCFPRLSYLELTAPHNYSISMPGGLVDILSQYLSKRAIIGCSTPELAFVVVPSPQKDRSEVWSQPLRDAVPGIVVREIGVRLGR
ncbi:hypothetical protein BD779DRAFT_1038525 [Infundibulicybe gibba]|nr:hypothetical protein BD779DRAFT_1038525 [Infundibulicybe gibba]